MNKLSIIVPIYNVQPYLKKCVDSLLHQDYDNYEIILVDDGSTDGSGELADELAAKSPISNPESQITVLHQPNAGLSAARNAGIHAAKGAYICFVDSDDYWESNVLGGLMAQVERDKLDVLRFKWQYVNVKYEVYNPYKSNPYAEHDFSDSVTDGDTFLNTRQGTACYAWQYILRRDLVVGEHQELFTEGIYFEDTDWTPRMLLLANRIASTDTIVYNYFMREGSITHAINLTKQRKVLEDKLKLLTALVSYKQLTKCHTWLDRMIAATVVSVSGILASDFWKERHAYLQTLNSLSIFPLSTQRVNTYMKRKICLLNISPRMAVFLLHIKGGFYKLALLYFEFIFSNKRFGQTRNQKIIKRYLKK